MSNTNYIIFVKFNTCEFILFSAWSSKPPISYQNAAASYLSIFFYVRLQAQAVGFRSVLQNKNLKSFTVLYSYNSPVRVISSFSVEGLLIYSSNISGLAVWGIWLPLSSSLHTGIATAWPRACVTWKITNQNQEIFF